MSRVQIARRKMFLHQQLSNYNRVAMRLSERLHELHKYAASIARGYMSPFALAGMPQSCMSRAMCFFENQFSPNVQLSVYDRLYKVGLASNNPNLQTLTSPQNSKNIFDKIKLIQSNMPFEEASVKNSLAWGTLYGVDNNNLLGQYANGLAGINQGAGVTPNQGSGITAGYQQPATSTPAIGAYTQNQQDAALEHMVRAAYKEELRELQKAEAEEIKAIEDEITQEQQINNTRLQVVQTELKEVEQHEKDAIDRAKPTYA